MKSQIDLMTVKNKFHFCFFNDDKEIEKEANLKLRQLLLYAPPGSVGMGIVELNGGEFLSTITVQSHFRSFASKAIGNDARSAIQKSLERLEKELFKWRFGGGQGNSGLLRGIPVARSLPFLGGV